MRWASSFRHLGLDGEELSGHLMPLPEFRVLVPSDMIASGDYPATPNQDGDLDDDPSDSEDDHLRDWHPNGANAIF